MAGGLLDLFMGDPSTAGAMDPRAMGLLGMAGAMGQAYAPQAASRLPVAQPNMAYLLGQAAGGYGGGYGQGMNQQMMQAQTQGQNLQNYGAGLKNLNDATTYNMWAPYLGQPPIPMPNGPAPQSGMPGQAPMPQPSPAQAAPSPMPAPAMPQGGPPAMGGAPAAAGAAPAAAVGGGALANLYQLPPPLLQRMGITVPPELTAAFAAGMQPGTPPWQTLANNAALKASGMNPTIGGDRPGVPLQQNSIGADGKINTTIVPGQLEAMTAGAMTQVPAKAAEAWNSMRAKVAGEAEIDANKYRNQFGTEPPAHVTAAADQKMSAPGEAIKTPNGSVVPSTATQVIGPGSEQTKAQLDNSQKTEQNWNQVRPSLDQTENRLSALGKAFQTVKAGGGTEAKATIANNLRGVGLGPIADQVMSAKDTAAVQSSIWLGIQDVLGSLKQINTGTGGRILNSEVEAFFKHGFNPNMDPTALHDAISQQLGSIYQTRNMIDDYFSVGKPGGWRDANQFQSAYLREKGNALGPLVDQAQKAMGDFKGMGQTKTIGGKTYVEKGGQWFLSNP